MKPCFKMVCGLISLALVTHCSAAQEPEKPKLITVNSVGEVRVKPDVARLMFTVSGQASSITEAQAAHDKLLAKAKATLSEKAGDAGKVEISGFDIGTVQTNYGGRSSTPSTVGYRVSSDVDLVIDLTQLTKNRLAELAAAGVEAGAALRSASSGRYSGSTSGTGPSFVAFELRDSREHRLEALRKAVSEAGPRAETAAAALGATLGKVESVHLGNEQVIARRRDRYNDGSSGGHWADIVIQSSVTVNYAITF